MEIQISSQHTLPVTQATVNYIGGLSPQLEWAIRGGISGHDSINSHLEAIQNAEKEANAFLGSETGQRKLNDFLKESVELWKAMIENGPQTLEQYLPDQEFVFIIGFERSGGTYLYTQLCELFDLDWQSLSVLMCHDSLPTFETLWDRSKPQNLHRLYFEWAQYLVWVKRELSHKKVIVQKRTGYTHGLDLVEELFRDRHTTCVTVRHPYPSADSLARYSAKRNGQEYRGPEHAIAPSWWFDSQFKGHAASERSNLAKDWNQLTYHKKLLYAWQESYVNVIQKTSRPQSLELIPFGPGVPQKIQELSERFGRTGFTPKPFGKTDPKQADHWPESELYQEVTTLLSKLYSYSGLIWPIF